ncbi:MAG TPA: hypothetical protein PLC61_00225 [Chitinophagales bacterium]|nr:hypothetical protein [Chitinophagales bacterium]HMU98122.1 hypothetical protein [Chitinophagales bacterium]HMV02995.1 hypothetical protein [Chitinophagales bacterium]HMW94540.1 hypothetical protein [Chitinophagales bacterium]HMY42771.1 hypothetical protein [Chitinophagales bacterium]
MKNLIIALLLLISVAVNAQTIVGCENYDENTGKTTGEYSSWDISANGGYVYLHYSQPKKITKPLTLYVDKKNTSGNFVAYATEYFENDVKSGKNFAVYDFKFTEAGTYKIIALADGQELASKILTIQFKEGEEPNSDSSNDENSDEEVDTYYYEESTVVIATDVDEDYNPIGEADEFYAKRDGTTPLKIVVSNPERFATELFYIDIYYTDPETEKEVKETTLETEVNPDWIVSSTDYTFKKRGKYYIDVYNGNDVFINSASIEIK